MWTRVKGLLVHPAAREDGWKNFTTGVGTSRDKNTHGHFWETEILQHNELLALFNGSDLAAKAVCKVPEEMMRRGYELTADGASVDDVKKLRKLADDLRTDELFEDGQIWADLFGGGLLLMNIDDGQTPDQPLNEDKIRGVDALSFVDRRFIWVQSYYSDPLSPKYGLPETYLVTNAVSTGPNPAVAGKNGNIRISVFHESRCMRLDGQKTDLLTRQQLAGWGLSVLQRSYVNLRKFEHAYDSGFGLLADASQAVFKLRGLIDAVAANRSDKIKTRMRMLDEGRSAIRAIVIDAGNPGEGNAEEFKREPTPFAGIPDMLDRAEGRLAACFDMPRTELFGDSPGGLGSNGSAETRKWYDKIASRQTRRLAPLLKRWYSILRFHKQAPASLKKKDLEFEIEFTPLYAPTDLEQAQVDKTNADRDVAYIAAGVVSAEEVALDRQDLYPSLDVESREEAVKGAKSFDPHENDPTDPALATAGAQGESQNPAVPVPLPGAPEGPGGGPKNT